MSNSSRPTPSRRTWLGPYQPAEMWSAEFKRARRGPMIPEHQLEHAVYQGPTPREEGWYEFDHASGAYMRVREEPRATSPRLRSSPIPFCDGSGQWWLIQDRRGMTFWRIEAGSWREALAEKKRLCRIAGYRFGDCRLVRAD